MYGIRAGRGRLPTRRVAYHREYRSTIDVSCRVLFLYSGSRARAPATSIGHCVPVVSLRDVSVVCLGVDLYPSVCPPHESVLVRVPYCASWMIVSFREDTEAQRTRMLVVR